MMWVWCACSSTMSGSFVFMCVCSARAHCLPLRFFVVFALSLSRGEDGARARAGLRVVGGRSAKSASTASHFCPLV